LAAIQATHEISEMSTVLLGKLLQLPNIFLFLLILGELLPDASQPILYNVSRALLLSERMMENVLRYMAHSRKREKIR
jgi:hypothetical protein